ncbi:DUF3006 domain-containing protein [Fredinandcohnia humi]
MKSGKYTLDRFEGDIAVLLFREDESFEVEIQRTQLAPKAKEGDILRMEFNKDGILSGVQILQDETDKARKQANDLLERLKRKN